MSSPATRLAIIGTGRVGLVAGAGFAERGNDVVCVDVDERRMDALRRGDLPVHEPQLQDMVKRNVAAGRLSFTTKVAEAVRGVELVFLAVGTPAGEGDGSADLRGIDEAAQQVARALTGFAVIVNKSTVPVGTAERVRGIIASECPQPFVVASNPEFMKEGDAVNDFMRPERVILGVDDERAARALRRLYAPFAQATDSIMLMDIRSAELTKYAANAMLAVRLAFMNELACLADLVGADIDRVRDGIGRDPRIGSLHLFPGPGFGGSCLPKDVLALGHTAREHGARLEVVEAAWRANARQKHVLGERVRTHFGPALQGRRIAVWGLSFKADTDDIRDSPALTLIDDLLGAGVEVVAHDPAAMESVRTVLGDRIELAPDMYAAARDAHALVVVTDWAVFRDADLRRLKETMADSVLFDGRNLWNPVTARGLGFLYYGIGRGKVR